MGKRKQHAVSILDGQNDSSVEENFRTKISESLSGEEEKENSEENNLNVDKEKIVVDLGLDISTATVGVCLLEQKTGKLKLLTHKKLTKFEDEYAKAENFDIEALGVSKDKYIISRIFIEEAAKKFSPGFSSASTIMTLGRFNGIISYMVYSCFGVKPVMINVRSARAKLGIKIDSKDKSKTTKQKILEAVLSMHPDDKWWDVKKIDSNGFPQYSKANEDRADSYVICRGGQLITP